MEKIRDSKAIAGMNDLFRKTMIRTPRHKIVLTEGVATSPIREKVIDAVRSFDTFTSDNDPYEEHEFGMVVVDGEKFFFKIDYYDVEFEYGADPHEDKDLALALTIMRADEY
jgi:hypothetical protein